MPLPSRSAASSTPEELFAAVRDRARRAAVLASVESVLGWDEQTYLPRRGGEYRADQVAALAALAHEARTDPAYGEDIERLASGPLVRSGPPEIAATVRLLKRDFDKHARLPARLVAELARTCVAAQQAWRAARAASDWPAFVPWVERVFALKREQAACQCPDRDPYDALMDDYEPDASWRAIAGRFERLRGHLVKLVKACTGAVRRPDDAVLRRTYPVEGQQRFTREVAARIGFDFDRGRLDPTTHPFCSSLGPDDCRITARWDERSLSCGLYGVLHEAGHGMYEQGLPRDWHGLPPGQAASLGVHESQSRLWENLVGRSPAFWEWCFPVARAAFPAALADSGPAQVQRALLVVRPSFIRVEADEVTYNLHVMLRFDLERALVQGTLAVTDLRDAWNERFEQDFGIRPPTDADGVLQDVHWSAGLVGYFPTYTLGNLFAAQLMNAAEGRLPGLAREIAAGDFRALLDWLRTEVHAHGRLLGSETLVERASGAPVSEEWLVASLCRRYGEAHGL